MIRRFARVAVRFLSSAGLAIGLLAFVGVWSALATVIPQGGATTSAIMSWATSHPIFEPAVRVLGLHRAFTSIAFLGSILLLGLSTSVCAWRRTGVALSRSRSLGSASRLGKVQIAESHDLEVTCRPGLSEQDVLSIAAEVLASRGIRAKRGSDFLAAVSAPWTVWGSAVFHWALVALIVVVIAGQALRSEGAMALAVSETKADEPASYLSAVAGPFRSLDRAVRSIRLDALEPDYKSGGIDRGAVPTVSILDGAGTVLVKQRVYPNNMLHSGSLAINAPGVGLAVWLALIDSAGAETGRIVQYVDFSQTAPEGTVPVQGLTSAGAAGSVAMTLKATVPLDRYGAGFGEWIPRKPAARLVVTTEAGKRLLDRVVQPDETAPLPGGGSIRLLGVGWYSRLSLVDDPTIPLIYAVMIIAMLGLTMTVAFRQQLLVACAVDAPDGVKLAIRMRLWRNVPTSRAEIESELVRALGSDKKESAS